MNCDELCSFIRGRIVEPSGRVEISSGDPPSLREPASERSMRLAESRLRSQLPSFLRRIYSSVGNGGFGPGAGLLGVEGGHTNEDGENLVESYERFRSGEWPVGLLPLFDLGGGAWAGVVLGAKEERVTLAVDSGPVPTKFMLDEWFEVWARGGDVVGEVFEISSAVMRSPFTGHEVSYLRRGHPRPFRDHE